MAWHRDKLESRLLSGRHSPMTLSDPYVFLVKTLRPGAHEFCHTTKEGPQKTPKFMGSLPHDRAHITCWLGSG